MKIVFTGGGTGGHFYPLIAVAEKVNKIIDREKIVSAKLYFFSSDPYDREVLFGNALIYEEVTSGKMRTFSSIGNIFQNFLDLFKILFGVINAAFKLFTIFPDVVFGKGGYASFPTVLAARILGIPVVIHESDSVPGRVNKWAGRFARKIAISFKEAADYFPAKKTAWTGQPIRAELEHPGEREQAVQYFKLESNIPTVLILGGSQGAELINNTVIDALPRLVENFQVIHQTGVRNFEAVKGRGEVVLLESSNKSKYLPFAFLSPIAMKMAAGAASVVVSRAGSTIFEIACWGVPSILIPFSTSNGDHAKKNAFNYAHFNACVIMEEANMTGNILSSEIERLLTDKEAIKRMSEGAKSFHKSGAAEKIAEELVSMALSHEK